MGHPDKVSDQISDAILDSLLTHEPDARCAVETLVTTGLVVCAGEVRANTDAAKLALANAEETVREAIRKIGYTDPKCMFEADSCGVVRAIHNQSADIAQGVDATTSLSGAQGAGDQGLMFGFACRETKELMPLPIHLSHRLVEYLAELRETNDIPWLRPDSKSQVTVEYDADGKPARIDTIVISTQHTEEACGKDGNMSEDARKKIIEHAIKPVVQREMPELWSDNITFHINPTGKFIIGGPHGDAGLTGRKIIVDTYGGRGRHGGGAFSGKDPSKVDRSAAYMSRNVAKTLVAAGVADEVEVQLAYAIGVAEPVSVFIDTYGTGKVDDAKLSAIVREHFDLTPGGIVKALDLLRPIYFETARNGHFGRELPEFTWEATPKADAVRKSAGL